MSEEDKTTIRKLIKKGYMVEVSNPDGASFNQRYSVWQNRSGLRAYLKSVIVSNDGEVRGVQG
jgi:hypothetical protein